MDFLGPHFGGFPVKLPQKTLGEKIEFAAQQLYTKIRFLCFVVLEKSVQKLGRKKRKKERNKPHHGQKWVGWDERVS